MNENEKEHNITNFMGWSENSSHSEHQSCKQYCSERRTSLVNIFRCKEVED